MSYYSGGSIARTSINRAGFSPLDLTGIQNWYDASDESTITKDGSDRVSQWDDKGPGADNLVQATGGNQPLWLSANRNSLDVIDFVGDRWMDNSFTAITAPMTVYYVSILPPDDGANYTFYDSNTNLRGASYKESPSEKWQMFANNIGFNPTIAYTPGNWEYLTDIWNDASSARRFGGVEKATGNVDNLNFDGITVQSRGGQSNFGLMKMGEIIIVDGLSSAQDIANAETFLANKWGF